MMNEDRKVMNALVNLMVCPRCPGDRSCKRCSYIGKPNCYDVLTKESMSVLNAHFCVQTDDSPCTYDYEMYVYNIMRELGMPAHLMGYDIVRRAIMLVIENNDYIHAATGLLYPTLAKEFSTTPAAIERAIRHAIEVTWTRGDREVLYRYFGNAINGTKGKSTNTEFIATIANYVRLNCRTSFSK